MDWIGAPFVRRRALGHRPVVELDRLLLAVRPRARDVRVLRISRGRLDELTPAKPRARADLRALRRAYHDGYTIVINGFDQYLPAVARLCRRLGAALRRRSGANLYATPPRAQGFLPHFDDHDVFVFQLDGEKTWRIHASASPRARNHCPRRPGRAEREVRLAAGDLLYLPQRRVHQARTASRASLHLTIGVWD